MPDLIDALTMPPWKLPNSADAILGDQAEFLNRVHTRSKSDQVVRHLVVIHAIEQEIVCLLAVSVDIRPAGAPRAISARQRLRIRMHAAGCEQGQLNVVAGEQGEIDVGT